MSNNWGGKRSGAGRPLGSKTTNLPDTKLFAGELLAAMTEKGLSLADAYIDLAMNSDNPIVKLKALNEIRDRIYGRTPEVINHTINNTMTVDDIIAGNYEE